MFGTVFEIATWYFYPPRWPEACVRRRHGFQTASAPLTPLLITGLRWAEPSPHLKPCPLSTPFRYSDFISIFFFNATHVTIFSDVMCLASVSITVCTKMQTQWEEGLARHTQTCGRPQVSERQVTHAGSPIQHSARLPDSWKSCKRKK